jgi:signal transduction histidine kinase
MNAPLHNPRIPYHYKLLISIVTVLVIFAVLLSLFQHEREKSFRVELMTEQIQSYNNLVYESTLENGICDSCLHKLIQFLNIQDLRITIIDYSGNVLYDSEASQLTNHSDRPEIKEALATGRGTSVRRLSSTTGKTFFYAATRFDPFIVRCSRPYDTQLNKQLRADNSFIIFTGILLVFMVFFIFRGITRIGKTIGQLRDFAENADSNRDLDTEQNFPNNELGEISQHIIGLFKRMVSTRDDLILEREKLYSHLQTAREGLAVYGSDKKEITANNLFIQYMNLISNVPVQSAYGIFEIPELKEIVDYINQNQPIKNLVGHLQQHSIQVDKNGHIFLVQSIIFQDRSFEISINDITHNEEDSRLKRQLTQNIAHELKTPISSIQGYMETILENPHLPEDKQRKFIERSYLQSKRLSELLRDISTLTRMDDAPRLVEKEVVNIADLISRIIGEVENEANQKNARVVMDIPAELCVHGNPSLLYSIFRNLTDNALAYAGENIEIGISCFRNDQDRCYFVFYDTGEGVPEEHLNRIFERFYRVDKGRTRKLGGTGLGLAIVKNAVQLHGGTISAKNRVDGGLEVVFSMLK